MKKTFTILHTNDLHSSFIGMGPAADYTPFSLNDDATRGGYARLAGLIAKRKAAQAAQGPVLVLDAGDYSKILVAIPTFTKGRLPLFAKNKDGQPLTSRVEALDDPRSSTAQLMAPKGTVDESSVAMGARKDAVHEIKE
jgi:hypothetical protein